MIISAFYKTILDSAGPIFSFIRILGSPNLLLHTNVVAFPQPWEPLSAKGDNFAYASWVTDSLGERYAKLNRKSKERKYLNPHAQ